jgi:hypothetical protein
MNVDLSRTDNNSSVFVRESGSQTTGVYSPDNNSYKYNGEYEKISIVSNYLTSVFVRESGSQTTEGRRVHVAVLVANSKVS